MISRRMPWPRVPCRIWLQKLAAEDEYGNQVPYHSDEPDIVTECCYAPGRSKPATDDDIEQGRPWGDEATVTFYLPKTLDADLRGALIQAVPANDATMASRRFSVVGNPMSYMRDATPGDMSWSVEGVLIDG